MTQPQVPEIDAAEAHTLVERGGALLLDVREDDEWGAGHAPRATHTVLSQLDPAAVSTALPVVAICRSGKRSGLAAQALAAAGHDVHNLTGGMQAWSAAGLPVVRDDGTAGQVI